MSDADGLHITRRFTEADQDPYQSVDWATRTSRIANPDGSVVFEMADAEVPASWSQVATDIIVSKYFRKAGVPQLDENGDRILDEDGEPMLGPERSARQVIERLAGTWRWWGENHGYFASAEDAMAFEDELAYMLLHQMGSPNSPQWFNTGLNWAYGLTGPAQGFWCVDPETEELVESPDAYSRPAPHACFPAGTRIATSSGMRAIEKIEVGDEVLTHNGRYQPVIEVMQRQVDERLVRVQSNDLSEDVVATANHPIWTVRAGVAEAALGLGWLSDNEPQWVPAGDLEEGDFIVLAQPSRWVIGRHHLARITSIETELFYGTVYNFHVSEDESYVARGVVVHNCFIQSVADDLVNPGGIMDLWVREARLFKFGSGCTSGESRIYVEGHGFIPIRNLFEHVRRSGRPVQNFDGKGRYVDVGDLDIRTLSIDEETGEYRRDKVELIWQYDVDADEKLTVCFDTGARATVSSWHPFLLWDGEQIVERRADQLQHGDAIIGPNRSAVDALPSSLPVVEYQTTYLRGTERQHVTIDADLAWLCGYFLGDGSLGEIRNSIRNKQDRRYDRLRLRFHDETEETLQRVQGIMGRVFGESSAIYPDGRESNGKHLTYTGRHSTGFFAALFGTGRKTYSLTMPSFVWESGREIAMAFLAGLIDSDGYVTEGRALYASAALEFAKDVATLASLQGSGGGVTVDGNLARVVVLRRSVGADVRRELALHLTNQRRRSRLLEYRPVHERKFCMPLSDAITRHLFGDGHAPADWLRLPVDPETFHLGRLHYEGLINRTELERATVLLEESEDIDRLVRIAQSLAFVTSVESCTEDPDFYDLTMANHANYLAGETGLVAIHNTGTNFSSLRAEGEPLSGGGKSSGLMSFLKVGDRAAGAIKSGGTTRRAAKMVILDLDHPDIETFINWKAGEEKKVRALIAAGYPSDFNGEAYQTVSGQNSNNSVRVPNEFIAALENDGEWQLTERTTGEVRKAVKARSLWRQVAEAAWACADPGVQFDTTINEWHTSPAGGRIRATNPCSEYVFLDNTACNLASINLVKFYADETGAFHIEAYRHAIRLWTIVLEISVAMAHFPSKEIGQGSYDYRTLGLGYANLGSLLMRSGIPYDSDDGRAITGALTAVLTGEAYATSAEMASAVGPFPKFHENREAMLRVIRNHRRAAYNVPQADYESISHYVTGVEADLCPPELVQAARSSWDRALDLGERYGYRNAQTTCIAPTGTIGLQMDCDTTGVEPDFALVKFKKLAGGGYFKIANQSISPALRRLGYDENQIEEMVRYVVGTMTLEGGPHINRESLAEKGLTEAEIDGIEAALPSVFELRHAFNVFVVGEPALRRLGLTQEQYTSFGFDLLSTLGFSKEQIREANDVICGRQTIEGAPHLEDEHLPVFDTANRNGRLGQRFIHHTGHIKAMASAQPFISGAISKTINMPNEVTVEEIEESYMLSWELGLKAMALYRDGSKASQPLSATSDDGEADDEVEGVSEAIATEQKILTGQFAPGISPSQVYAGISRPRFLLPARRRGWTQEARIGGHKVFLRTGEYDDGSLGEIFIDLAKEGATLRGIISCFAIAVSKGLQYGVPLEEFVDTFTFHTFEPRGLVEGHPNIKMANSIVDYVFRAIGLEYLDRTDLVQVPPVDLDLPEPPKGLAMDTGLQLDLTAAAMEEDIEVQKAAAQFVDAADGNGTSQSVSTAAAAVVKAVAAAVSAAGDPSTASVQAALGEMMGDAPLCDTCGHITVRNGSCYKCLNCGNSLGCS